MVLGPLARRPAASVRSKERTDCCCARALAERPGTTRMKSASATVIEWMGVADNARTGMLDPSPILSVGLG